MTGFVASLQSRLAPWREWQAPIATPAILFGSLGLWWLGVWAGVSPRVCSILAIGVMVGCMAVLDVAFARPDLPARPAGLWFVDLSCSGMAALVAVVLPSFVYLPLGALAADQIGTAALWSGVPLWASLLCCVLAVDFLGYWWHRLQHTTGESWLWRLHSVHHAPTHFDFWMAARVHPLDMLGFGLCSYGLLSTLGAPLFSLEFTAFLAGIVGAIHHTRAETSCGWLNRWIPMGDHHLFHHSRHRTDNGNFGNITTLFDQLFGTWVEPRRVPPPIGAWSLAHDYPHDSLLFLWLSPFGAHWQRAHGETAESIEHRAPVETVMPRKPERTAVAQFQVLNGARTSAALA